MQILLFYFGVNLLLIFGFYSSKECQTSMPFGSTVFHEINVSFWSCCKGWWSAHGILISLRVPCGAVWWFVSFSLSSFQLVVSTSDFLWRNISLPHNISLLLCYVWSKKWIRTICKWFALVPLHFSSILFVDICLAGVRAPACLHSCSCIVVMYCFGALCIDLFFYIGVWLNSPFFFFMIYNVWKHMTDVQCNEMFS